MVFKKITSDKLDLLLLVNADQVFAYPRAVDKQSKVIDFTASGYLYCYRAETPKTG